MIAGEVEGQHASDLERPWRRIRERAGLEDVRIHDLRHIYASNALASGLPLEMVGKLLGHTSVQTKARYAHLADAAVHDAANSVAAGLATSLTTPAAPTPKPDLDRGANVVRFPERKARTA